MLDRFRFPLIILSALTILYGGWLFAAGKRAVDYERLNTKPKDATLDEIVLNPPSKSHEWYRITDGGASIGRGVLQDYGTLSPDAKNVPFFLYAPILRTKDAAKTETIKRFKEDPPAVVLLRSKNKDHRNTYKTFEQLESASNRTIDIWLAQNKEALVIRPPFTGLLVRRGNSKMYDGIAQQLTADFPKSGWILLEGERPPLHENLQVALGLALMMGIPTFWLFALLITGKFAPPDEESLPLETSTKTSTQNATTLGGLVMPFAMPLPADPPTKTPRP